MKKCGFSTCMCLEFQMYFVYFLLKWLSKNLYSVYNNSNNNVCIGTCEYLPECRQKKTTLYDVKAFNA